jgi:glycosyltransferase involved in cell wall biosynthesis
MLLKVSVDDSHSPAGPPAKVLFVAYACEPGRGSEWGMSWNLIREIARTGPVWVIAHEDNRAGMEAYLRAHDGEFEVHVEYVKLPGWLGWMRNSMYSLVNVHYYLWQFAAARVARRLHRQIGFDVSQHLSYCRWWMPSAASALAPLGVKFVFGPIAGGDLVPEQFRKAFPPGARREELQRRIAREFWRRDPLLKRCIRRAASVIASTPLAERGVRALGAKRVDVFPCVALGDASQLDFARQMRARRQRDGRINLVAVGGVTHYRGIDVTLRAIAKAKVPRIHYTHACGGTELGYMKQLAEDLGIAGQVTWLGETDQATNMRVTAAADAFVHCTLRDNQGLVLNALALGIPAIVFDHNSSALMVGEGCGHRLRIGDDVTPDSAVNELASVLRRWHDRPELLEEMAPRAIRHSEQFTHAARGDWFRSLYSALLAKPATPSASPKPASSAVA